VFGGYSQTMLTIARVVPIHIHAAVETLVGPVMMFAPFVLGFSTAAMIASFLLGVLVIAVALTTSAYLTPEGARRSSARVSAHAEMDLGITIATAACAIGFGLTGDVAAGGFFGTAAIALSLLGMTTRYGTLP
jgi:hypothetical protein